jgi:hypothetical protein
MEALTPLPNISFSSTEILLVLNEEPKPNNVDKMSNNNSILKETNVFESERNMSHTFDDIVKWLHVRCPDLSAVNNMFNKEVIIKGYVQSGKTSFMLCTALKFMFGPASMSSIIVLRNATGDYNQISLRLKQIKQEITDHLHLRDESILMDFKILDGNVNIDKFKASMNRTTPQIFFIIGNESRLKKLNKLIKGIQDPKFALFIDEADSNDTGDNKRKGEIEYLKTVSDSLFYISATILDIGMRNDEEASQTVGDVYMLGDVPHYLGLEKLIHRSLPEPAIPCSKVSDDPFLRDPNLNEFIQQFSTFEPHDVKMFGLKHPQHCLISCGAVIAPQRLIFNAVVNTDCAVILYNGDGIDLYHSSLIGKHIVIPLDNGRSVTSQKCTWQTGAHSFSKSIGIAEMIQFLKDNGGVERFPRIITISGKLAGRGISFVSADYGKYLNSFSFGMPKIIGWRLTSMYYIPSPSTSQPNLMQAVGRCCCVVRDNIPTYIYVNEDVFIDLRKAYWTQEELVIRARAVQDGFDIDITEAIKQVRMNKSKLSKRRLTVTGAKRVADENIVESFEDDGGFSIETYNDVNTMDDEWEYTPRLIAPDRSNITIPIEEFNRLTGKMFGIWSKNETSIARFMQQLDPDKMYTSRDLKESCLHNSIRLCDIVADESGKSNKYGSIMEKKSGGFMMYKELVESYKNFF